ncbi:MAG TPA: hypothetical protein VKP65_11595 [Rhodothermales bacterium]|nr:hypothetical protein [Rhodothermales bacterium]
MKQQATNRSTVEICSYNLKPGTRTKFHRLVVEEAVPMLQRWSMDVVAYGPSLHEEDSYILIRAFTSLKERQRLEDAFYGSVEWREGPRNSVLTLIESYTTVVLDLGPAAVDALRTEQR